MRVVRGDAEIVPPEPTRRRRAAGLGAVALGLIMSALGSPAQPEAGPTPPLPGAAALAGSDLPLAPNRALPASPALLSAASLTGAPALARITPPAATLLAPADPLDVMAVLDDHHLLAIGDVLSFRIVEDEEDARILTVTDAGDLELPGLGRFPAEQRTCKQLARELKAALEQDYYYHATVIVAVNAMTKSRGKVYLVGPIRTPGVQELPSDEVLTVSKAILRAGGFTDFADRKHVKITRENSPSQAGKATLVVDVGLIYDAGRTELDVALQPGDLIYIPERWVRF
jgi:protein involved in polysaccharide export with SLBB domain